MLPSARFMIIFLCNKYSIDMPAGQTSGFVFGRPSCYIGIGRNDIDFGYARDDFYHYGVFRQTG